MGGKTLINHVENQAFEVLAPVDKSLSQSSYARLSVLKRRILLIKRFRPFAVVVLFALLFGYPYYELTRYIISWAVTYGWRSFLVYELIAMWADYVLAFGLLAFILIRREKKARFHT